MHVEDFVVVRAAYSERVMDETPPAVPLTISSLKVHAYTHLVASARFLLPWLTLM
jgi:hypothetical protein